MKKITNEVPKSNVVEPQQKTEVKVVVTDDDDDAKTTPQPKKSGNIFQSIAQLFSSK